MTEIVEFDSVKLSIDDVRNKIIYKNSNIKKIMF